ncbi:restriction endonuclease subunit S [uncultured Methanobrevibacter sp.]|uniref:restriction endonuclease subunit S n=1 Tax=uncultured Methanobrevibacter sp. TaxID=253161 RepID=UPI0025E857C1|nr:restriction endonuclease subunit S [uncultured Methanobrevibacter sp.]
MSLEFTEKNLNEIYTITSGLSKSSEEFGFGFPFLSFKTIFYNYYINEDLDELVNSTEEEQKKHSVKKGDVFLTRTSETLDELGMSCVALRDYPNATFNGFTKRLRPKKDNVIYPLYACYYFRSTLFRKYVDSMAIMTTRASLNNNILSRLPIIFPNYEDQKKIGYLLHNLDKKIELNKEINNHLENLLMSIFNSWFINFEVYNKSNGMKFDESFGDVPRLWSVEMLEDYVDFVTGVEPGSKNYHEKPEINDIPFIRVGDLGSRTNAVFIDKSLSKNKILSFDDIVLSLDATVGIVKMGLKGAYSTGMRKLLIKNDDINKPFLYCLVKSKRIQRIIETFATGTTILHAGKSIKHMNFVLSDKQTMNQFGKIGNPILSIILANLKEIEKLTNMRDMLLPKLMSGEINVSEINYDLE